MSTYVPARNLWASARRLGRAQAGATCARAWLRGGGKARSRRGEHLSAHPSSPEAPERKVRVWMSTYLPARNL